MNNRKESERYAYNDRLQNKVTEQLKQAIKESGFTQSQLLEAINSRRDEHYKYTEQNFSRKISWGRITYWEVLEIAEALGYEICWRKIE